MKKSLLKDTPQDIQLPMAALKRAAMRARTIARATGTPVVISIDGVIRHMHPDELDARDRRAAAAIKKLDCRNQTTAGQR